MSCPSRAKRPFNTHRLTLILKLFSKRRKFHFGDQKHCRRSLVAVFRRGSCSDLPWSTMRSLNGSEILRGVQFLTECSRLLYVFVTSRRRPRRSIQHAHPFWTWILLGVVQYYSDSEDEGNWYHGGERRKLTVGRENRVPRTHEVHLGLYFLRSFGMWDSPSACHLGEGGQYLVDKRVRRWGSQSARHVQQTSAAWLWEGEQKTEGFGVGARLRLAAMVEGKLGGFRVGARLRLAARERWQSAR
jgi:hypothetical protein